MCLELGRLVGIGGLRECTLVPVHAHKYTLTYTSTCILELKRIVNLLSGYPDPNSSRISYG